MNVIMISAVVIGVIGVVIALALNFAGDKFYVEPNEKANQIRELLPGNNCGGCGYAGCDALAEAIAAGGAAPNGCPMCTNTEQISGICGVKAEKKERKVAFVSCIGDCDRAPKAGVYQGVKECAAAKAVQQNGGKACRYGCMGFGDCISVCPFGAIRLHNGVAVVDERVCTGCGQCVKACPNHLISFIPADAAVKISCSSPEKGMAVKQVCSVGCLGCGLCEKNCPHDAIAMDGMLPVIDYSRCTGCGTCAGKCPVKVIR